MPPRPKADTEPTPVGTVHQAIRNVMADLGAITKSKTVTEGPARFKFRGVDDVMNALHDPLVKHGLTILPQVQERIQEARLTRSGQSTMTVTHLRVRFLFTGPDGSETFAEAWGEGQDSGDKSTGKAHSMAYKSALLQAFHVETEDTPDADTSMVESEPIRDAGPHPFIPTAEERIAGMAEPQREWLVAQWKAKGWPALRSLKADAGQADVDAIEALITEAEAQPPF